MEVKWSAPFTPTIQLQILLNSTSLMCQICLKGTKKNVKRQGPLNYIVNLRLIFHIRFSSSDSDSSDSSSSASDEGPKEAGKGKASVDAEKPPAISVKKPEEDSEKLPNNGSKEAQEVLDSVASYSEKEHGAIITSKNTSKEELIEVEDNDDYLMYLEDILKTIHKAYYELYDQVSTLLDALVCRFLA